MTMSSWRPGGALVSTVPILLSVSEFALMASSLLLTSPEIPFCDPRIAWRRSSPENSSGFLTPTALKAIQRPSVRVKERSELGVDVLVLDDPVTRRELVEARLPALELVDVPRLRDLSADGARLLELERDRPALLADGAVQLESAAAGAAHGDQC